MTQKARIHFRPFLGHFRPFLLRIHDENALKWGLRDDFDNFFFLPFIRNFSSFWTKCAWRNYVTAIAVHCCPLPALIAKTWKARKFFALLSMVKKHHALLHAHPRLTHERHNHLDQSVQVSELLHHFHHCLVSTKPCHSHQRWHDEHCHELK